MVREREDGRSAAERPIVAVSNTKYVSGNPVARWLLGNFASCIAGLLAPLRFRTVLEVGCGEGILLRKLAGPLAGCRLTAVDIDPGELAAARANAPFAQLSVASAYRLPFPDGAFDLVLCSEVLEHLERPDDALTEIARVGTRHFVFSVPNEPLWRVLNLCRGTYLSSLGNTPGHLQHWGREGFVRLLAGRFEVEALHRPLPWLAAVCRPRGAIRDGASTA